MTNTQQKYTAIYISVDYMGFAESIDEGWVAFGHDLHSTSQISELKVRFKT